jgi:uncharacterized protein (DUF4415 family)
MISDEADEDADSLDDEAVLETYLGVKAPRRGSVADSPTAMPDWPQSPRHQLGLDLDADTLAWFKANHADWRSRMAGVLRAWVAARTRAGQSPGSVPQQLDAIRTD